MATKISNFPPEPIFKVGDKVIFREPIYGRTYGKDYYYGGYSPTTPSLSGTISEIRGYVWGENSYKVKIKLSTKYVSYIMLEKELMGDKQSKNNKQMTKMVKLSRTKELEINGKKRDITITALYDGDQIKAGYAVRNVGDSPNRELAVDISTGRALKEKTNLVDMRLSGSKERYILYAVVDNLFKEIKRGKIEIKGVH